MRFYFLGPGPMGAFEVTPEFMAEYGFNLGGYDMQLLSWVQLPGGGMLALLGAARVAVHEGESPRAGSFVVLSP